MMQFIYTPVIPRRFISRSSMSNRYGKVVITTIVSYNEDY